LAFVVAVSVSVYGKIIYANLSSIKNNWEMLFALAPISIVNELRVRMEVEGEEFSGI
jgi:hypothetical protein